MKRYLSILFLLFGLLLCFAQQYPVRLVPVVFPPYNVRLSDYALNSEPKLQLQVLMTDLLEPPHKTGIKFSLKFNNILLNSDKQLINGSVETAYDAEEGNVERIENFLKEEYTEVEQIINKGIQDKKLSQDSTYQIEYTYFDTDRDKGCIAYYDWVIGTHLRYKTYEGIKGITKFGIAIDNELNYADVHGASANPKIIKYLEVLKQVKYTQNLNSEGKIFYKQQPAGKYLFWKIDNQFIDANHPQFDEKLGKINHNLKCRK